MELKLNEAVVEAMIDFFIKPRRFIVSDNFHLSFLTSNFDTPIRFTDATVKFLILGF
jgi:hypothetical protein